MKERIEKDGPRKVMQGEGGLERGESGGVLDRFIHCIWIICTKDELFLGVRSIKDAYMNKRGGLRKNKETSKEKREE